MEKVISKIQFITNYQSSISHFDQAKKVLEGGVKWIQYRPKSIDLQRVLDEGGKIAELCKQNEATFIVNDYVEIAKELNADGVHIGKNDMSVTDARILLGEHKIIGGTANTLTDVIDLANNKADYIGLGPYRFTQTKKNLSRVIGAEGYTKIISCLKDMNIDIPIIAIGGIQIPDINILMNTGVFGIAISSLLSDADNITEKTNELCNIVSERYLL